MFDTIVAISTAINNQAISIIRMSGSDSINIINEIFTKNLSDVKSHTIHYGFIKDNDEVLDEVLVSVFKAPKTYTKEDIVEINAHGGSYVTRKILALILSKNARLAMPGEFTKRAYLNGRIDLTEAESINDMIKAENNIQAKSAIRGLKGSITKIIDPLLAELLRVIGTIEVNIDYPEYDDVEVMTNEIIYPKLLDFKHRMEIIIDKATRFRVLKDGIKVAIVGKPNVGKSSILNALLEKDKAIVTDVAGTTRDLIEGDVHLENITLHLIDTAGIRESEDVVEKIGIERSKLAISEADLVLFVTDNRYNNDDIELFEAIKDKKYLKIINKADLDQSRKDGILISALNHDIGNLVDTLNAMFENDQALINEDILNNERQISLMMKALNEIIEAIKALNDGVEIDLISTMLYGCYHNLKEIKGDDHRDDLIDSLFKNFCLGK
ncbi:MAG: tRNA uridine-5-carboxymethylaminomethyl(34) synthesis GTPase MnmE [Erysipelotrichaceae bacterium]|nr:tRNA uridine-5-carboxymethylaminomethyl(34) synthesis GTPase MnmE [Erysipelotrichaceae bacterium]